MRAPASGLLATELGPAGHEAGHLDLGQRDLLAAEFASEMSAHLVVGEGARSGHA